MLVLVAFSAREQHFLYRCESTCTADVDVGVKVYIGMETGTGRKELLQASISQTGKPKTLNIIKFTSKVSMVPATRACTIRIPRESLLPISRK